MVTASYHKNCTGYIQKCSKEEFFSTLLGDKSQSMALSQDYKECGIGAEKLGEFAKKVGSITTLDIMKNEDYYSIDYTINHLKEILQSKSLSISKLIWKTLVSKETGSPLEPDYFRRESRRDGRCRFCT